MSEIKKIEKSKINRTKQGSSALNTHWNGTLKNLENPTLQMINCYEKHNIYYNFQLVCILCYFNYYCILFHFIVIYITLFYYYCLLLYIILTNIVYNLWKKIGKTNTNHYTIIMKVWFVTNVCERSSAFSISFMIFEFCDEEKMWNSLAGSAIDFSSLLLISIWGAISLVSSFQPLQILWL